MSVALVMSTIDSIQIGIMGLVAAEVLQQKAAPLIKLWTSASIILVSFEVKFVIKRFTFFAITSFLCVL